MTQVILITGQSGTCKRTVAEKLAAYIAHEQGVDLKNPLAKQIVQVHEVEAFFEKPLDLLLDTYHGSWRKNLWDSAMAKINKALAKPPQFVLLLFHAIYYRSGRVFSDVDWTSLRKLKPNAVVTLIDDIFDVWERIRTKETESPTRSRFSLTDVLLHRSFEISSAAQLANNLSNTPIPHYVFANKHSVKNLYDLLLRPKQLRIYASYPIAKPRISAEQRAQVDRFRDTLAKEFTIFDPLTIDELRCHPKLWLKSRIDFSQFPSRWPVGESAGLGPCLVDETIQQNQPLVRWDPQKSRYVGLTCSEVMDLYEKVKAQVVERDFQLVSQSEVLVAYRPMYGRKEAFFSGGVGMEIMFAAHQLHIPVAVFHPYEDYARGQSDFFRDLAGTPSVSFYPELGTKKKVPFEEIYVSLLKFLRGEQNKRRA